MLRLNDIKHFFPQQLHQFQRFMLREYLQYKILEIIFESDFASKLSFLGGTCLRVVHENRRFSEDLDFDNFDLTPRDFDRVTSHVKAELELWGCNIEMRNVKRGAYHCHIKFPDILFDEGLSGHKEEKILIQLDTEAHGYSYKPNQPIINKFDVFTRINVTPDHILAAQKFFAVLNRKRNKGLDFYDIVFLLGKGIFPDYEYLNQKLGIDSESELKFAILERCREIDMNEQADDVMPYLFDPKEAKKVRCFVDFIQNAKLTPH